MKKIYCYLLPVIFFSFLQVAGQQWEKLGDDKLGDGAKVNEPDLKTLYHYYDISRDTIMFLILMNDSVNPDTFGINVAMNVEGAGTTTTWFGPQNTSFELNRLLTFWLEQTPSGPTGIIGIADAIGVETEDLTNINNGGLKVLYNTAQNYYIFMAKRSDIFQSTNFKADILASVGLPGIPNDDIPDQGSFKISDTQIISGLSESQIAVLNTYPNPSSGRFFITLPDKCASSFSVTVFNITAQKVYKKRFKAALPASQVELDLSSVEAGIYHLLLESPEGSYTCRILKK